MTDQVDYRERIPNNVDLAQDARVKKALEKWHPGYLDWWMDMGPEGFQTADVYLRTAVRVESQGPDHWADVRLRADAAVPVGHPARAAGRRPHHPVRRAQGRAGVAGDPRRVPRHAAPPDRDPGRHRARVGRAAALPGQDRAVALRHAQPVPGERRGGPSPVGDGLPAPEVLRARRPRGGRAAPAAPLRQRRLAAHARRLQRGDARLAVVLHVHVLHRPRRQDAARVAGAVGLRSAVTHLPLHADRGSVPHVRRRERRVPHHRAHL